MKPIGAKKNKIWAESLKKQLEDKAEQDVVEKSELAEIKRAANLGQKMLTKAHVDLDHLRESYSEKLASETVLVDLVKELREKLTLASKYYYKLQQEHPELLGATEQISDEKRGQ